MTASFILSSPSRGIVDKFAVPVRFSEYIIIHAMPQGSRDSFWTVCFFENAANQYAEVQTSGSAAAGLHSGKDVRCPVMF